jgi:hypothetical protein
MSLKYEPSPQPLHLSSPIHPGGNPWANQTSISHRCYPIQVAFVWELSSKNIHLPLGCLQGGCGRARLTTEPRSIWKTDGYVIVSPRYLRLRQTSAQRGGVCIQLMASDRIQLVASNPKASRKGYSTYDVDPKGVQKGLEIKDLRNLKDLMMHDSTRQFFSVHHGCLYASTNPQSRGSNPHFRGFALDPAGIRRDCGTNQRARERRFESPKVLAARSQS